MKAGDCLAVGTQGMDRDGIAIIAGFWEEHRVSGTMSEYEHQ
jgi:hypothetical protein